MSDLRTDDLRDDAGTLDENWHSMASRIRAAADEIDRLRELVDVLKSVPGSSIVLSKDEYDALTAALESPPKPTQALRNLMAEGE